jgi:hypothetical protein
MMLPAGLSGLKERELELAEGRARLLSFGREAWDSPVRRIDDE